MNAGGGDEKGEHDGEREKYGLIPHLVVNGAGTGSGVLQDRSGAVEVVRMPARDGKRLMHVELKIGDAALFLCDDFPDPAAGCAGHREQTCQRITLHLDVTNCDGQSRRPPRPEPVKMLRWICSGAIATARSPTPSATSGHSPIR
ncbi:MAG: hypothetical protein U0792_15535 [Gemmataceae bacterium]